MCAALVLLIVLTVLTGVVYPAVATGVAQLVFPWQANGSLIVRDGKVVGLALIGQPFEDPKYFWGRPSPTSPYPYNAAASSGSIQGPKNPALYDVVKVRVEALRAADPGNTAPVPVRPGDGLGQRPRSAYQPGGGALPGRPRRQGPQAGRGDRAGARRATHRGPAARLPRRAAGERPLLNLALDGR
jgi:hypothetical protein